MLQYELLLSIQMWIQHPPIIGKNYSTWVWLGHTYHSQATQVFTYHIARDVLKRSNLGRSDNSPGTH